MRIVSKTKPDHKIIKYSYTGIMRAAAMQLFFCAYVRVR